MKQLILLLMLITLPSAVFALEQSFTQQGLKATIKLSPEKLETESNVQLSLNLSKDGASLTDKDVTLEVYERNNEQPVIKRRVDVLDTEYVDSWKFEKAGDYKVVINIADHQRPDEIIHYESMQLSWPQAENMEITASLVIISAEASGDGGAQASC